MGQPVTGLTPEFVANALGLPVQQYQSHHEFSGVTSDSRGDVAGSLFVAIRGERFDGHDFINAAVAGGAAGVIAERGSIDGEQTGNAVVYLVEDSVTAWRQLAACWRQRFDIPIVAVGGAAGKTTTKNLLASMLRGRYQHVLATAGSQNGYLGLAMTLTDLREAHEAAVIEIGIDACGAMAEHAHLVRPSAALVTVIGAEHLETLGDIETVATEEGQLLEKTAAEGGSVFIHEADPWLAPYAKQFRDKRCIRYALDDEAPDADALHARMTEGHLVLNGLGLHEASLSLPLIGRHNALNCLAAAAVALEMGLTIDEIGAGLNGFQADRARSNIIHLENDVTVLADYYNASPISVAAALHALHSLKAKRRWVVLGDMLELGPDELTWHRQIADPIIEIKAYGVLLYGSRMRALHDALKAAGFQGEVAAFDSKEILSDRLVEALEPGDVVLVKGSRGMTMEDVMPRLMNQPQTDG